VTVSARRLRTPEERVGQLPNASLPPPVCAAATCAEDVLLQRALGHRDETSCVHVFDRYFPAMLRLASGHVDSRATAEEVVQEAWLAAIRGIAGFEGRSSLRTWLFRILRNIARARGRRDARERPFSELQAAADDAGADPVDMIVAGGLAGSGHGVQAMWVSAADPEQQLLARELAVRIEAAIATLPPRQREVLVLRDVEGRSAAEVCDLQGLSDANQRVILHRARDRVRNELRCYLAGTDNTSAGATAAVRASLPVNSRRTA
jgi:RNA polymerase sigma-70 factor, ECF subfamily